MWSVQKLLTAVKHQWLVKRNLEETAQHLWSR